MLHPHVPEELKHFGKHLFATFLGLLMALGLEQWREHRHEAKLAHEALVQVEAEIAKNIQDLEGRLKQLEAEEKPFDDYVKAFVQVVRERREGRRAKLPENPRLKTPDLFFTSSAWEAAKALGLPRHLSLDRSQRLSEAYTTLQRAEAIFDGMVSTPAIQDLIIFGKADPESLSPAEVERVGYALRFHQGRQQMILRMGRNILKELREAQRP